MCKRILDWNSNYAVIDKISNFQEIEKEKDWRDIIASSLTTSNLKCTTTLFNKKAIDAKFSVLLWLKTSLVIMVRLKMELSSWILCIYLFLFCLNWLLNFIEFFSELQSRLLRSCDFSRLCTSHFGDINSSGCIGGEMRLCTAALPYRSQFPLSFFIAVLMLPHATKLKSNITLV